MANTTKKRATELEKEIAAALAACPDPMSRNDFRKACHIGTRTSIYLLQSGLVPCHSTGKRTRCYRIAKADVADYLRRRAADPARYTPPSGWYKNYPNHKPPENALVRRLDPDRPPPQKAAQPPGQAAGQGARCADLAADLRHYRLQPPHGQPLVHRGAPQADHENAYLPGAQGLAAGLPVFGRLQQHLPQKPEAQPDGAGDAGIVRGANT